MIDEILELRTWRRNLRLDASALDAYRNDRLKALIRHAYDRVPFYRSLLDEVQIEPADIRSVGDLDRIPIVDKSDLRQAGQEAIQVDGPESASATLHSTSGSSGATYVVRLSQQEWRERRLVEFRTLLQAGLRARDRLVVLGPMPKNPIRAYQRLGLFRRQNVHPIASVESQMDEIRRMRPSVLWIYPSFLEAILRRIGSLRTICRPRVVITSAEILEPRTRQALLEDGFEVFEFYGATETGRIAWECPRHDGLHLNADRLIFESVPTENPGAPDGFGRAVITVLDSRTAPFIRYRLDDLVRLRSEPCACGCTFPLIDPPLGRSQDLVRLPDGQMVSAIQLMRPSLREAPEIERFRFVQDVPNRLIVELECNREVPSARLVEIEGELREYLGESMRLDFRRVSAIDDSLGSKVRHFVSRLPPPG